MSEFGAAAVISKPPKTRLPLTVPMKAMGKPRPRATRRGRIYMPKAYVDWCNEFRRQTCAANGNRPLILPDRIRCAFVFAAPPSDPMRRGPHKQTPDSDNCTGAVMDALTPDESDARIYASAGVTLWGYRDSITIFDWPLDPWLESLKQLTDKIDERRTQERLF